MVYRLASITKEFTAAGIMLLEESGKISLIDDVSKYVPELKSGRSITIEQLLWHNSGLVDFFDLPEFAEHHREDVTAAEAIRLVASYERLFWPGTEHRYSNSNYLVLASVIERVSGIPYEKFISKFVLAPLSMSSTAVEGHEKSGKKRVNGYIKSLGKPFTLAEPISMSWLLGSGDLVSNVFDLAKWNEAITSGKLLRKETWERMQSPGRLDDGRSIGYGFGFIVKPYLGRPWVGHNGLLNGFRAMAGYFPNDQIFIAVLMNGGRGAAVEENVVFEAAANAALGRGR